MKVILILTWIVNIVAIAFVAYVVFKKLSSRR